MELEKKVVTSSAVMPEASLAVLSQREVNELCTAHSGAVHDLFRRCALAVLSSGSPNDDVRALFATYRDFAVHFEQVDRGILLHLSNAPAAAFVDGEMIRGIRQHLFAVLRDLIYVAQTEADALADDHPQLPTSAELTDRVFHRLRHAGALRSGPQNGMVVCWGGHSVGRDEYDYTKEVGHQLGLRGLDICTGCGPGAMKGPMKGAAIAHAKQRMRNSRYLGITEPGIIAAEAPNAIVNELVIMTDIEKRLEAFTRLAHGMVVFPGGVGTTEEVLYLLGVLSHPDNAEVPLPVILSGPAGSERYFDQLLAFVGGTLGRDALDRFDLIIADPARVARTMRKAVDAVIQFRDDHDDAAYFNWLLRIDLAFQTPFVVSHEAMGHLVLDPALPTHELACNLRRMFSGLVAGNIKEAGVRAVEQHGPFRIHGHPDMLAALDTLLRGFVADGRMRLPGRSYEPCYEIVTAAP